MPMDGIKKKKQQSRQRLNCEDSFEFWLLLHITKTLLCEEDFIFLNEYKQKTKTKHSISLTIETAVVFNSYLLTLA